MVNKQQYIFTYEGRVYVALFIFIIFVIWVGLYSVKKAGDINERVNNIFTQELQPLETLEDIKASMYRIRERAGRHITEPERHAIHKEKIEQQLVRMARNKKNYNASRLDTIETELINQMNMAWSRYVAIIQTQVLPLSQKNKQEQAEDILYGQGLEAFRKARQALNDLSDYQIKRAEKRQHSANHAYISILQLVLVVVLTGLVITVILVIRYRQTQKEKKYSDLVIRNTAQAVMVTDKHLKIISVNKAFENITGYTSDEVLGHSPAILSSGRHNPEFYKTMWRAIKEKGCWEGEIWNKHKNGSVYPEWLNIVAFHTSEGDIESYAGTFIDISALKAAEEKVNKLAYYDELTGLGNSHLLQERLSVLLGVAKFNEHQVALLLIDLKHFKDINTSLGRHSGDTLLREMARLLERDAPPGSLVIRYDSDRFIIVLTANHLSFTRFNEQLVTFVNTLNESTHLAINNENNTIKVSWSVGIACYPRHTIDANILIQQANIALFHNKLEKHNNYTFYKSEFSEQRNHQYQLGLGIAKAIERDELFLVYQPQVNRAGEVTGAEVLLRWQSKEFGLVPPDSFIPLAEESGDIIEIGQWVFNNTLSQIKTWQKICLNDSGCFKRIAINVSPHQIMSANIIAEYDKACHASGVPHHLIELEITETGIMSFSENIIAKLQQLTDQGFSLAIDDFGTGYSSLGRLQHFPVDILKIDRSFTSQIVENQAQAAIIQYIINMAHTLNMQVVAEGVETKAELDMLMKFGCDIFQGYYFAKPLRADEFIKYAETKSAQLLFAAL